ncbi:uncharacterized protein [Drosophila kikkawai]|uniref:Uncharacterized protein isoform X1 n=1 Tax=Drosophila kikkawai TaxID=30033 RepID=A0A6P4IX00_DROKI|nr:uncharacterized protein LOC108082252 isoform X1 [Drosophila kikkawai]
MSEVPTVPSKPPLPCGGELKPNPIYKKLMVENLTIIRPPILKIYYWESFGITGLNKKLRSNRAEHEHTIVIPIRQIHSQPLKVVFWLRNLASTETTLTLKRIQNCQCQPLRTQVGFNQYRHLFNCPHRRLLHINQEIMVIKPDEVVALTTTAYFFLYGEHLLTYEVNTDDKRKFLWHFHLEISDFHPEKCLLTTELLPVNIKNFYHTTQPIWVQNITMSHLSFSFSSRDRGLKLLNMNLTVPRQSVWPLLVDYRPLDYENEAEVFLTYNNSKARYKIKARGVMTDSNEETDMPLKDRECNDFMYVIYPNRVNVEAGLREERTQLVNVHNYSQKCLEFRWQSYIINEFFSVVFNPPIFRLKSHHSKLCVISVTLLERLVHFRRIPIVLEVHRILDRATVIAKQELSEIESIDDPKWKEESYLEHVYLQLNIRTTIKPASDTSEDVEPGDTIDPTAGPSPCAQFGPGVEADEADEAGVGPPKPPSTAEQRAEAERRELIRRLMSKNRLCSNEIIDLSMAIDQRITIFEKLFWKYLSKSKFMRINQERKRQRTVKTYEQVVNPDEDVPGEPVTEVDRNNIMEILSRLLQEAINDLAKNWVFIPSQYYERNT